MPGLLLSGIRKHQPHFPPAYYFPYKPLNGKNIDRSTVFKTCSRLTLLLASRQGYQRLKMLRVTRIVGHGKAIFVVYALTGRCQPAHCCAALYHGSSRSRASLSSNNGAQVVSAVSRTLRYRGGSTTTTKEASPRQAVDKAADTLELSNASPGTFNASGASSTEGGDEGKGLRQRAKEMISQFVVGTKVLWREIVRARETSARKKAGESLSFQEYRLLRQVCVLPRWCVWCLRSWLAEAARM